MVAKRKILFVNDEMAMGGVARVLNTLMKNLDENKYDIDLLVLHKTGDLLSDIPNYVHVLEGTSFFDTIDRPIQEILAKKDIKGLIKKTILIFYMKTGLIKNKIKKERKKMLNKQYDVELAAKEGFCTVFTAYGDSLKKINWVLTDYSVCNYSVNHMKLIKEALRFIDLNVADSKQAMRAYEDVFELKSAGLSVHNLMDIDKVKKGIKVESEIQTESLNVITVVRFHPQKATLRLIKAHEYALSKGIEHHLYLIGGGEEEEMLKEYVKKNKLDKVMFMGVKSNPYADVRKCDLFVLPSLYEGFATIVNESLLAGTPVLSTRVAGIDEQIIEEHHGFIVENTQEALNEGVVKALSNPQNLSKMKEALASYDYPNEEILKKFNDILS